MKSGKHRFADQLLQLPWQGNCNSLTLMVQVSSTVHRDDTSASQAVQRHALKMPRLRQEQGLSIPFYDSLEVSPPDNWEAGLKAVCYVSCGKFPFL